MKAILFQHDGKTLASSETSKEMESLREMTHTVQNIVSAAFTTLSFRLSFLKPLPGALFSLLNMIQAVWSPGGLYEP